MKTTFRPAEDVVSEVDARSLEPFRFADCDCPRLVFVNGRFTPALSTLSPLPAGVRVGSLAQTLAEDRGVLEPHLARHEDFQHEAFSALNTAFLTDGAFVSVPRGVSVEKPVHVLYVTVAGAAPVATQPRTLVITGEESQVPVVEVENGNITNKYKQVHPGRTVTSFINGTRRLFDFVHDNLAVEFHPCDRTNDTAVIRRNPRVVAINSAIQVDLSGQVVADSFGHRIYSGIGGQMDFIRGAPLSRGGKPIIALPYTGKSGTVSRICTEIAVGAGGVTTRGHVHWIVTEYGAVNLHGKTLRERAQLLISIAHPDFRAELARDLACLRPC